MQILQVVLFSMTVELMACQRSLFSHDTHIDELFFFFFFLFSIQVLLYPCVEAE